MSRGTGSTLRSGGPLVTLTRQHTSRSDSVMLYIMNEINRVERVLWTVVEVEVN